MQLLNADVVRPSRGPLRHWQPGQELYLSLDGRWTTLLNSGQRTRKPASGSAWFVDRSLLPTCSAPLRRSFTSLAQGCQHTLSEGDVAKICEKTEGYSGSDMKNLVQEAARAPLRELRQQQARVGQAPGRPSGKSLSVAPISRLGRRVRPVL